MTSQQKQDHSRVALVSGGSSGLGKALVEHLAERGWRVITDARDGSRLAQVSAAWPAQVVSLVGDVRDIAHRGELAAAVTDAGRLDLLVHNASALGPGASAGQSGRLAPLAELSGDDLAAVWNSNVTAAHELNRLLVPTLTATGGVLVSVSSDAAVEHYSGWGAYGASKASLDHLTLTTAVEAGLSGYAVDPGDMRTPMHQAAFPGEDIGDRPLPEVAAKRLLDLLDTRPTNGRYRLEEQ